MAEHNSQEKKKDLENAKELVAKFERRINAKVRRQEKLDRVKEGNFRREELPEKYIAKMLYEWNDRKFEDKYLKKLERNWKRQKGEDKTKRKRTYEPTSSSGSKNLKKRMISDIQSLDTRFFI